MIEANRPTLTWEMKDYLEKRREELKARGESGFTLMEMLIVVAIIAVLVAIAIPVFTAQLEKAREATDLANIRSAYAEVQAAALTEENSGSATVTGNGTGMTVTAKVNLKQQQAGWQSDVAAPKNLESASGAAQPTGTKDQEVTITYTASTGKTTINLLMTKTTA